MEVSAGAFSQTGCSLQSPFVCPKLCVMPSSSWVSTCHMGSLHGYPTGVEVVVISLRCPSPCYSPAVYSAALLYLCILTRSYPCVQARGPSKQEHLWS